MNQISIKNVRSLEDIPTLDLKPLTVLLGKNSSGKSTFLRIFPLLKQSCSLMTRGVLSFFGDFVDFGEFKDIKTSNITDDFIELGFDVKVPQLLRHYYYYEGDRAEVCCFCKIKVQQSKTQDLLYIAELELDIDKNIIYVSFSESGNFLNFTINATSFVEYLCNVHANYERAVFFPSLIEKHNEKKEHFFNTPSSFYKPFLEIAKKFTSSKEMKIFHFVDRLPLVPIEKFLQTLEKQQDEKWTHKLIQHVKEHKEVDALYRSILFMQFPAIIDAINMYLFYLVQNIFYSKPLRANAERFYRSQSLTVNEISPDGSNLVPFINNLSSTRKTKFNTWTQEHFGFAIHVKKSGSHHSIILEEKGRSEQYNVTDMGFGFSQVIPIITQLWDISTKSLNDERRRFSSREIIYTIEQPELHLHPALQALVLETFVEVIAIARKSGFDIKIILETHSETMVNYLGKLVAQKKLSSDDISLLIFEKKSPTSPTVLRKSTYDTEGVLDNWPLGFFSATRGK